KGKETRMQYALNPLIDRLMDQDGLPALLALGRLATLAPTGGYILGLEVLKGNQLVVEFDFLLVQHGSLIAGETKAGTKLEARDYARAHTAASLGVSVFYFCTPGNFAATTMKRLARLAR